MRIVFIFLLCILSISAQQEWRGFWVDAWNKGMYNQAEIKEMISTAKNYGYNAIAIQVRCRGDALYFPKFPNIEPRRNNIATNFDPLQQIIQEAHANNLEVHAWATTFLVASSIPSDMNHVYNKHNDYLMESYNGEQKIVEGYYLDPGHPEALEWNRNVVLDIVQNYKIDGFHFDYIRYPQQDAGYNPVAIARFNKEYKREGKPSPEDKDFSIWRRAQISNWLRNMYTEILSIKPNMKVTAATFSSRHDAYSNRFQDWSAWMKDGILDANFPMNYARTNDIFETRTDDILQNSHGRHVYMGVGNYLLDTETSLSQLQYARDKGSNGLVLFSYANNTKSGKSEQSYQMIYQKMLQQPASVPDMPWKKQKGHIFGQVVPSAEEKNIEITIVSLGISTFVDHQGRFSFPNLLPGEYELICKVESRVLQTCKVYVQNSHVTICNNFLLKEFPQK